MKGGGNVYNQAAGGMQGAMGTTANVANSTGPTGFGANVGAYQNPYNQQVLDRTMSTLEDQRQMQMNNIGAAASAAGAFGGSRHGVAEAQTNKGFADTMANTSAQLLNQGYNTAASNMFQDRSQALGAAGQMGNLSGQAFGMGQDINSGLAQQGTQQQAITQALMDQARQMFGGWSGAPAQSLQYPLAAIGGVPTPQSQTTQQTPGLFDWLSLGLSM